LEVHQLLQQEMEAKKQLVSNNKTILTAYNKVVNKNNQLQREIALIKYRLNLM
jgi:septation ring formation regulator EzrA